MEQTLTLSSFSLASFFREPESPCPFWEQPRVHFTDRELFAKCRPDLLYISQPLFASEELFSQVKELTERAKMKDIIPPERIWMGIYFDREICRSIHPEVSIRFIDNQLGFGVFAEERIPSCAFVGEYTGLLIPWKKKSLHDKFHAIRYTIWGIKRKKFLLDGERVGNFTRCINHSTTPNLCLQSVYWKGIPRFIFLALKEIAQGEQLTFDYGTLFWKEHPSPPRLLF
ncbi:MAG: SET domain-containing protein-lysine N-methyltransferase [Verrucomicrobiota bacterium]|nr:SET domain-containing protein-lysine N-methyltransferase [Verrucomicrobiota bacterium]